MGPPSCFACAFALRLGAGMDVHLGPEIVRRRDLGERRDALGQRPREGPLVAAAEFLIDRRALGGAIGELGDHDVDIEALASRELLYAARVGGEFALVL